MFKESLVDSDVVISAESKSYLAPGKKSGYSEFDSHLPYNDEMFINVHDEIYYGVTHAISIESIMQFIQNNKSLLKEHGYNTGEFFMQ